MLDTVTVPDYTMHRLMRDLDVSCDPHHENGYVITIKTNEKSVAMALSLFSSLMEVGERMHRAILNVQCEERGRAQANVLHLKMAAIAKEYQAWRAKGYKHRAALAIVAEESVLAKELRYTTREINACVKTFPHNPKEIEYESKHALPTDQFGTARGDGAAPELGQL